MSSELLNLEEILTSCQKTGLDISERTFRYYAVIGLLPAPVKQAASDARIHYYDSSILERLRQIRNLQAEGHSLKQVKKLLQQLPQQNEPSLGLSISNGTFTALCQDFLNSPSTQVEKSAQILLQGLMQISDQNSALASEQSQACIQQLCNWHRQQSPKHSLKEQLRQIKPDTPQGHQVHQELILMLSADSIDHLRLLELRHKLLGTE